MFNFWYSNQCTRQIKLIICIVTCTIIYACSSIQQLTPLFTGISLSIGLMIHMLRNVSLKISTDHPYKQGFQILFSILPIISLITLINLLPAQNKIYLAIQCIAFTAIGLFIVSIYENRAKRFE
ncbi:hypothetical protein [Acinetobacter sp. ANC 4648]|uniref:hypothetical protein n=1 Tax=Acinetobacter sp. ANC 4648 TaxID=1977875 RepID=UPI000A33C8B7|nr:hypothetical protein [Acinetobacter sp. ANC 4648]OTG84017.1 hypothetical protein B9T27_05830 [Acinetobacter sp. ANC 4648]